MPGPLWRVLIAVISVVLIWMILPPFFRVVGFDLTGDVLTILNVAIAGIALFYMLRGPPFPPS